MSKIESSPAISFMPSRSVAGSHAGNSSIPLGHMNALKPTAPRPAISASRSRFPGTNPPHSPKSSSDELLAASSLLSNAAPSTVTGRLLSGMSMKVV
ncbi:MAG TPA: hypothetical protein VET26_02030 [Candidatus Sulfotelmatobacter sp.]|nr:hypothetical protein [Candidatus Sulfotelmatobacter sp.]